MVGEEKDPFNAGRGADTPLLLGEFMIRGAVVAFPSDITTGQFLDFAARLQAEGMIVRPVIEIPVRHELTPHVGEVAMTAEVVVPPTATLTQFEDFAEQRRDKYLRGKTEGISIWNALRQAERVIEDAKVFAPGLRKNPGNDRHIPLGNQGLVYKVNEVIELAKLDLRFINEYLPAEDKLDETRLDLVSLFTTLPALIEGKVKLRHLSTGRIRFLVHFVNVELELDPPLALP